MAIDPISISAIVISISTTIGAIITGMHIKRMNSGCCNCECYPEKTNKNSPPDTPINKQPNNTFSISQTNLSTI
jgi:hypothetical protein